MSSRWLAVTIDTEVDKGPDWRISNPVSFESVRRGIPEILSPLFDHHGVVPTYLLSPEVIEDPACVETLAALGDRAELGTHLHAEFAEPDRILTRGNMAGRSADAVQCTYPPEVEVAKLAWLTERFEAAFGYRPRSFRAGRFGMGPHTLEALAELDYTVDSSVTPGIMWRYEQATLNFSHWVPGPIRVDTPAGSIWELPVSIRPGSRLAPLLGGHTDLPRRVLARLAGRSGRYHWLRPSWVGGPNLVRYVEESDERFLVLMLHSMEIIPGASPYAADSTGVERIVTAMDHLFAHCRRADIGFCCLRETARIFSA